MMHTSRFSFLLYAGLILAGSADSAVSQNLQAVMSVDKTQADIGSREMFEFTIQYNCASTTTDSFATQLTDTFPASVEVVGIVDSPHIAASSVSANTVTFDFIDPLPAGATGDLIIQCRFYETTPSNTTITNSATISSSNFGSATSNSVNVEGINGFTPPSFTPGVLMRKSGYSSTGRSDTWSYYLYHGNTGDSGSDLANYQVEDILPAGVKLVYFDTGLFPGTSNPVNAYYQVNAGGSWLAWPGNPLTTSGVEERNYVSDLGLAAGDYVSAIRLEFGTLTGGGQFYPEAPGTQDIKLKVELVDPSAWSIGDTVENCATASGGGYSSNECHTVTFNSGYGNLTFVDGASVQKQAYTTEASTLQTFSYEIVHGNTGESDLDGYVLEETPPAGVKIETFSTGVFPGPALPIVVNYKTNLNPAWSAVSGTYWSNSLAWIYDYTLGLGAGEYVSGFQIVFGTLPGGGGYHPSADGASDIDVWTKLVDPASWNAGDPVTNCASVSATLNGNPVSESGCDTISVMPTIGDYTLYQWPITSSPYLPGEVFRMGVTYGTDPESGKPMTDPVVALLLAEEFEYVGNETYDGWGYTDSGSPVPSVSVTNNFGGTGRQLVRYAFSPMTILPNGSWHHGHIRLDVRVKNGTPNGSYMNTVVGSWTPENEGHWWFITDDLDYDGDGVTTDFVARSDTYFYVDSGNSTASLDSVMWVKGALDAGWSRYPDSGTDDSRRRGRL